MSEFSDFPADFPGFFPIFSGFSRKISEVISKRNGWKAQANQPQFQEETQMYVLVIFDQVAGTFHRFVSNKKASVKETLQLHRERLGEKNISWRLWNKAWIDGSEEAWRDIQWHIGPATII